MKNILIMCLSVAISGCSTQSNYWGHDKFLDDSRRHKIEINAAMYDYAVEQLKIINQRKIESAKLTPCDLIENTDSRLMCESGALNAVSK